MWFISCLRLLSKQINYFPFCEQNTKTMEEQTLLQDLMELATHMRQERLFTQYELNNLQTLNEQVPYQNIVILCVLTLTKL